MTHTCCWCHSPFIKIKDHYWCTSLPCRSRQATYSVGAKDIRTGQWHFLYVPLPKQVEYEECKARNLLAGGAAGTTKSYGLRWRMYRRAMRIPDFDGLILRKTWGELEAHHLRLMEREARTFQAHGVSATFSKTDRKTSFGNGSVIECGHMENPDDVEKYLSRERDEISPDEGVTFPPQPLLELSTRARSTKPAVIADGGARFGVYTNPGGPSAPVLRDLFIDHAPDYDTFPALREFYDPSEWAYIPGALEDNPYLPASYERDLAVLPAWRYRQLRHNDWDVMSGQFFSEFNSRVHVKDLGTPSSDVGWIGSLDWGYMSPGCFAWWVPLPDGRTYRRFELKFQYCTIPKVVQQIREVNSRFNITRLRYIAADPAMWQHTGHSGESMAETFARNGLPLRRSNNERVNGWQRCREWLQERPDGDPWMIVHPDCRYFTRCVSAAISDESNPEDVDTDCEDHPLDEWRYYVMSRPSPLQISKKKVYTKHSVGRMFESVRKAAHERYHRST